MPILVLRLKDPVSGLSHLVGFLLSLAAGGLLLGVSRPTPGVRATSLVFVLSMGFVYLASAVYHLVVASPGVTHRLHILDRAAIFVMIAGTSTPYFFHGYEEPLRTRMLVAVWAIALLGVGFKLLWARAPRWLFVGLYLAMGWLSVVELDATIAGMPRDVMPWLFGGGVVYTLGAVVYAIKRPNPWPPWVGFHELWHLFVLGGTALHYVGVYRLATA